MMEVTRRAFLIGSACTALVPVLPVPVLAEECPRQKAFRLADKATREYRDGNIIHFKTVKQLFEHLPTVPGPERSFDETVEEIGVILRGTTRDGTQRNVDIMTCTNEAFAVSIVRDLLKHRQVPLFSKIYNRDVWHTFAVRYTKFIMKA